MNIDQFAKDLEEKVNAVGFTCEVKVQDTNQSGTYGFEVEINGRISGTEFDPDRQVHEVTRNILQLPGEQEGFIPSKEGMKKLFDRELAKKRKGQNPHKH